MEQIEEICKQIAEAGKLAVASVGKDGRFYLSTINLTEKEFMDIMGRALVLYTLKQSSDEGEDHETVH